MSENHTIRMGIDASGARKGAQDFEAALGRISAALSKLESQYATTFDGFKSGKSKAFSEFVRETGKLGSLRVNPNLAKSITELSAAIDAFKAPSRDQIKNLRDFARAVDSSSGSGVRSFANSLTTLGAAMSAFRTPSKARIAALGEFSKAMETLAGSKIGSGSISTILSLSDAFSTFRAPGKAKVANMGEFARALTSLATIRLPSDLASSISDLGQAMAGFKTVSKGRTASVGAFASALQGLGGLKIPNDLAPSITALGQAMGGFKAVGKAQAANLIGFADALKALGTVRLMPQTALAISAFSTAMSGFRAPGAGQIKNLQAFIDSLANMRVPPNADAIANALTKISRAATAASQRLTGMRQASGGLLQTFNAGNFSSASAGVRSLTGDFRGLENAMSLSYQAGSQLRVLLGSLTLGAFTQQIYEAGLQVERFRNVISITAGDSNAVAEELDYVGQTANRFGIDIGVAMDEYGKFATAARLSGASLDQTRYVFEQFSGAMRVMGLSADRQRLVFLALQQMFSKGTISSQELKQQLGEQIPGAYELMENAVRKFTGDANANLAKLLEQGKLSADAVFLLAREMELNFGPKVADALTRADTQVQILKNTWTSFQQIVAESGFLDAVAEQAFRLREVLGGEDMKSIAVSIGQNLATAVTLIGDALVWAANNVDTLVTAFKVFLGLSIGRTLGGLVTSAMETGASFLGLARMLGGPVTLALTAVGGTMAWLWSQQVTLGSNTVTWGDMFSEVFYTIRDNVFNTFNDVLGYFQNYIDGTTTLSGEEKNFSENSGEVWRSWGNSIARVVSIVWEIIKKTATVIYKFNESIFRSMQALGEFAIDWDWDKFTSASERAVNDFRSALSDAVRGVGQAFEDNQNYDYMGKWAKGAQDRAAAARIKRLEDERQIRERMKKAGEGAGTPFEAPTNIFTDGSQDGKGGRATRPAREKESFGTVLRDLREEYKLLQIVGAEREVESEFLRYKNQILKDGNTLTKEQEENLRNIIRLNREMAEGGFNGFQRWANGLQSFRESLIDVERNAVGGLSDALTDLVTEGRADFIGLGQDILRSLNKAVIDSLLQDIFKGFEGNSPLAQLFGIDAPKGSEGAQFASGAAIDTPVANIFAEGVALNGTPLGQGGRLSDYVVDPKGYEKSTEIPGSDQWKFKPTFAPEDQPAQSVGLRGSLNEAASIQQRVDQAWSQFPTTAGSAGKTLALTSQDIEDIKKTLATEWVTSAGEGQAAGIVDTILNRQASGKWGSTVAEVVDARKQFSDINGPVAWKDGRDSVSDLPDSMLMTGRGAQASAFVDRYLMERAAGRDSSVGDHLNYANPHFSDARNLGWISRLDGPQLGRGNAVHHHGTVPELQKYRPGDYNIAFAGMEGGGVNPEMQQLTLALQQSATAAQSASTAMMTYNTGLTTTTTQAQTAASSINTTAAGLQNAGAAAQSATPGLESFGDGVQGLLGQLAGSLGPYGGIAKSALGILFGSAKHGTANISHGTPGVARASLSAFSGAPHFAEGGMTGRSGYGGIPSILHPNEAVIPLTRGRKVPVELGGAAASNGSGGSMTVNINGVQDFNSFKKSENQLQAAVASANARAARNNN